MEKFQGKYRIETSRLTGCDYSKSGLYFVTICTDDRRHYFGEVVDSEMELSNIGQIVDLFWLEIPVHHPYAILDEYVVMPNHLHGILKIETPHNELETFLKNDDSGPYKNKFGPQSRNLSSILRGFKGALTKYTRICGLGYAIWQERFYDHIIGNNRSLNGIREYIKNNPKKWEEDGNNSANLWI